MQVATVICNLDDEYKRLLSGGKYGPHFSLANFSIRPRETDIRSLTPKTVLRKNVAEDTDLMTLSPRQATSVPFHCHGGILVNMLTNKATSLSSENEKRCLCPPTFYGTQCEYQSQRVTTTLRIGNLDGQTPFSFVIYLFDDKYHILQSFHQISYISTRDQQTKFSFHLLYSSRPKASDRNYRIQIDAFETTTLNYRASWIFPVVHSFLPVYRLSISLTVPMQPLSSEDSCPLKCSAPHGHCAIYANTGQFFCKCKSGWSGSLCTNSYACDCSPDSICVGSWNNRSICVCPLQKFGPRCYLRNTVCEQEKTAKCENGGQCISSDVRISSDPAAVCFCPARFYGRKCEYLRSRIDIAFRFLSTQNISDAVLLHFITVRTHPSPRGYEAAEWGPHEQTSILTKIPFSSSSIIVYWMNKFHLLFVKYQQNMYLLILQTSYTHQTNYNVTLSPGQRCPLINELLNKTIVSFASLRRVKYYHIPCQKQLELKCFHDEQQFMCLCTFDRRANCFLFDYYGKDNRFNISDSENGGQGPESGGQGPASSSKGPESSSKGPESSSKGPESSSKGPESSSKGPESGGQGPESSSKGPESSSKGPESSSKGPESSSKGPESGGQGPESSSKGPESGGHGSENNGFVLRQSNVHVAFAILILIVIC
jgi:hypothetical protein